MEGLLNNIGKDVVKEMLNEIKKRHLDENIRGYLTSVDYILDILVTKKKNDKK